MCNKLSLKYRIFIKDSIWSIAALLILNMMLQLFLYPILRHSLGIDKYGNILFLMGIINILATSVGCSANNSRLKLSVTRKTTDKEYNIFFLITFFLLLVFTICIFNFSHESNSVLHIILFWILLCTTTYRNYADVKYRLFTNYKWYFYYYLAISIGYIGGIFLYRLTHLWEIIFLFGECIGVTIAILQRTRKETITKNDIKIVFESVGILLTSQLLVNIVLNADRLVLKTFVNNTAVSIYYVASLIGKTIALITMPLNSVIIGHLANSKTNISPKAYLKISSLLIGGVFFTLGICVLGSHLFVLLFYPQEYKASKSLFFLANLAQILYFATGILSTILLRYINEKFQLYINIFYIIVFLAITIPVTIHFGLIGFSIALCIVNFLRFAFAVWIGYLELKHI